MGATEDGAFFFHAVTKNMDTAVWTGGRNALNGAFEAIERVRHPVDHHLKRLVVIVSAGFTLGHGTSRELTDVNARPKHRFRLAGFESAITFFYGAVEPHWGHRQCSLGSTRRGSFPS